jgi:hypothetical protein
MVAGHLPAIQGRSTYRSKPMPPAADTSGGDGTMRPARLSVQPYISGEIADGTYTFHWTRIELPPLQWTRVTDLPA